MNHRIDGWTTEYVNENEWVNGWVSEWMDGWMNERATNEQMTKQWLKEWMNKWLAEFLNSFAIWNARARIKWNTNVYEIVLAVKGGNCIGSVLLEDLLQLCPFVKAV